MHSYEIEIKTLLGSEENAEALRGELITHGAIKSGENSQLNHYFEGGDFDILISSLAPHLTEEKNLELKSAINKGTNFSIRTRKQDETVIFVIKYSIEEASDLRSIHGVARMEFENICKMSLDELDQILLDAEFQYQSKWSRRREEYALDDFFITIDLNAGYGYLAEFELEVTEEGAAADVAQERIKSLVLEFGLEELAQDRLDRMFRHYSEHWRDYYGTEKTFTIE